MNQADIDIDLADRDQVIKLIDCTAAHQITGGQLRRHASGIYVTEIPYDPVNDCATLDYETAQSRGYFKVDLLNQGVYRLVRSPEHYAELLVREPDWSRLWKDTRWASQLVHVGNYTDLLCSMRPDSVERMAAFIAIIRPGKAHLQNLPWSEVFATVWDGDNSRGFVFKHSHSVSYGMLVKLHMNLLAEPTQSGEPA